MIRRFRWAGAWTGTSTSEKERLERRRLREFCGIRDSARRRRKVCRDGPLWPRHRSMILAMTGGTRSEEHTSELQSQSNLVCRLLLEKKKKDIRNVIVSLKLKELKHKNLIMSRKTIYSLTH